MTSWVQNGRSRSEFGACQCCFRCRHIESSSSPICSAPTCKVRRAALKRRPDSVDMNNSSTPRCLFLSSGATAARFASPPLLTSQVGPLVHATLPAGFSPTYLLGRMFTSFQMHELGRRRRRLCFACAHNPPPPPPPPLSLLLFGLCCIRSELRMHLKTCFLRSNGKCQIRTGTYVSAESLRRSRCCKLPLRVCCAPPAGRCKW